MLRNTDTDISKLVCGPCAFLPWGESPVITPPFEITCAAGFDGAAHPGSLSFRLFGDTSQCDGHHTVRF